MAEKDFLKIKMGYLKEDFKFFHLKDKKDMKFEFHYHDFNKIIIFISGDVTYLIEGKAYKLKPWDILFVGNSEIHKPIINSDEVYERIIIWVNSNFLKRHNSESCNLLSCFNLAAKQKFNLLRIHQQQMIIIKSLLSQLEDEYTGNDFGNEILKNALFMQFIIFLNRLFLRMEIQSQTEDIEYDENIGEVINYINGNLDEDLSIDNISARFFISKYYLMHKFKKQTGYTIYNYILQKRLIMAGSLVRKGYAVTDVYMECGFQDYSNFLRAFKKSYGVSPRKYYSTLIELEKSYSKNNHE